MRFHTKPFALSIIATAVLSACGGGGGGGGGGNPSAPTSTGTTTSLTGVAASGAPIIGTVQVTDSKGAQKSVNTGTDGSYSIDVSGMTAPFVLFAKGKVGGKDLSYYAPATAEDIGKNLVNITPLSDLMLANVAGDLAANCAVNPVCVSGLTKAKIAIAVSDLAAKLAPVLTQLGLDAATDLLHGEFKAGTSKGIDGLLDVLDVSIDTTTKIATIKNLVSGQTTTDNVTSAADNKTAITASTAPIPSIDLLAQVKARLNEFSVIAASTDTPAEKAAKFKAFCSADFIFQGDNCDTTMTDWASSTLPDLNAMLEKIAAFDVSAADGVDSAKTITDQTIGTLLNGGDSRMSWLWKKGVDGKLYLAGDQKIIGKTGIYTTYQYQPQAPILMSSFGAYLSVDVKPGKDSGGNLRADSVIVTGPGMPIAGFTYVPSSYDSHFQLKDSSSGSWINYNQLLNPATAIKANDVYTFTLKKGSTVVATYKSTLVTAPMNPTSLAKELFPTISTIPAVSLCVSGGSWVPSLVFPAGHEANGVEVRCRAADGSQTEAKLYYGEGALKTDPVTLAAKANTNIMYIDVSSRFSGGTFRTQYNSSIYK